MNGTIAIPHWEACDVCVHQNDLGCDMPYDNFTYDKETDEIVCEDFERKGWQHEV